MSIDDDVFFGLSGCNRLVVALQRIIAFVAKLINLNRTSGSRAELFMGRRVTAFL